MGDSDSSDDDLAGRAPGRGSGSGTGGVAKFYAPPAPLDPWEAAKNERRTLFVGPCP
jgi:hypothetical protein